MCKSIYIYQLGNNYMNLEYCNNIKVYGLICTDGAIYFVLGFQENVLLTYVVRFILNKT